MRWGRGKGGVRESGDGRRERRHERLAEEEGEPEADENAGIHEALGISWRDAFLKKQRLKKKREN